MVDLLILIEKNGKETKVGNIKGTDYRDACFQYAKEYFDSDNRAISVSLPKKEEPYDSTATRTFFSGLLPEGFTRKSVAQWIKADENDYTTILGALGKECLGAIRVEDRFNSVALEKEQYKKMTTSQISELAREGAEKTAEYLMETHLSLAGASGKVGMYYDKTNDEWYMPMGIAPSTHIVKQSHVRLKNIVVNEQLAMTIASELGIETPNSFIVEVDKKTDSMLFATERFDRIINSTKIINGLEVPYRLHQEDFAQAFGIPSEKKYEKGGESYMVKMFELIRNVSTNPIEDQLKLWKRIVFNYLIGNTDGHIKNYSLLYSSDLKRVSLAPAYDLITADVYNGYEEMAFSIGGDIKLSNITRESFHKAAQEVGLGTKMAMEIYDEMAAKMPNAIDCAVKKLEAQGFNSAKKIGELIKKSGRF